MSKEEADESDRQKRSDDVRLQMALNESLDEKPPEPVGRSALLDLTEPQPVPVSDPWGAPEPVVPPHPTATAATAVDPWGSPAPVAPPSQSLSDPWGGSSLSPPMTTQSVGQPSQAAPPPASGDPWGMPAVPPSDPWGGAAVSGSADTASKAAPWGEPAADVDADFDSIRLGTGTKSSDPFGGPPATTAAAPADTAFDMGSMNDALPPNQHETQKKSAADFLGENSSLVNLDSLIGPTPQQQVAQPGSMNPFAVNTASKSTNPFQVQHSASPTLNQMKAPPNMGMPAMPASAAMQLPQPLLPPSTAPQVQQSTNPFLF